MSFTASLKASVKSLDTMEDLFINELKALYGIEDRVIEELPMLADAAHSTDLKKAIDEHRGAMRYQKERLEQCFRLLDMEPEGVTSEGFKGLLADTEVMAKAGGAPDVKDAALIAAALCINSASRATYVATRSLALYVNREDVADLLQQTIDEKDGMVQMLSDAVASWAGAAKTV